MATGLEELAATMDDHLITATEDDTAVLGAAGFVSVILDTRFFPSEPGAEHVGGEPHTSTLVIQFGSEEGAVDAVDLLHAERFGAVSRDMCLCHFGVRRRRNTRCAGCPEDCDAGGARPNR